MRTYSFDRPSTRTLPASNRALSENALPVRCWHARQWQMVTRIGSASAVSRSCPQLQLASCNLDPVLAERRQVLDPIFRDDDVVLDPDAEAALEVDARLDGDDVARDERVGRLSREARRLVDVEAETVAEPVAERALERRRVDHVARERIRLDTGDAGADAVESGLLRGEHDVVRLPHLAVDTAGGERARVVRGVTVDDAAGIDDDELAPADHAVARAAVWLRPGRARADDELERRLVRALVVEDL